MSRGHGLASAFRPVPAAPPGACLTGPGRDVGRRGRGARSSGDGGTTRWRGRSAWLAWCWVGAGLLVSGGPSGSSRRGGRAALAGAGVGDGGPGRRGGAGPCRIRGACGGEARRRGPRSPPGGAWRGGDGEPRGWARTQGGGATAAGRAGAEAGSCVGAARSTLIPGGGWGRGRAERVTVSAPSLWARCPRAGVRAAQPRARHLFCGIPTNEKN